MWVMCLIPLRLLIMQCRRNTTYGFAGAKQDNPQTRAAANAAFGGRMKLIESQPVSRNARLGLQLVRVLALGSAASGVYTHPIAKGVSACYTSCKGIFNNQNHDHFLYCAAGPLGWL